MPSWKEIKEGLSDIVSGDYLDFMSSRNILLLFISGMPVVDIADNLEVSEEFVENCLLQYFPLYGIMGIVEECNPAFIFRNSINYVDFAKRTRLKVKAPEFYYEYCSLFYKLEKELK